MSQRDDFKGAVIAAVAIIVVLIFIIWFGFYSAKVIYRYSRSVFLSVSWLIFHFSFWLYGVFGGEVQGDVRISGFDRLEHIIQFSPLVAYCIALGVISAIAAYLFLKLNDDEKDQIEYEKSLEKTERADAGIIRNILLFTGGAYLGYQAVRSED